MNYPLVYRRYFNCLAVLSIAGNIASAISALLGRGMHLDLTFILWLWLASSIGKAKNYARIVALSISIIAVAGLIVVMFSQRGTARFFGQEFQPGEWGYLVILGFLLIVFALPLSLLSPTAKDQFRK